MDTKNTSSDTAISVVGAIFGTAHFIFQTAADLTAHAEGKIVESISKGEITLAERVEYRKVYTGLKQEELIAKMKSYRNKTIASCDQESEPTVTI